MADLRCFFRFPFYLQNPPTALFPIFFFFGFSRPSILIYGICGLPPCLGPDDATPTTSVIVDVSNCQQLFFFVELVSWLLPFLVHRRHGGDGAEPTLDNP